MQPGGNVAALRIVPNRPRAVFDCVIFLQAAISNRGPAAIAFTAVEAGRVELLIADAILLEVEGVLNRPNIQRKFPQLSPDRIAAFLGRISDLATLVKDVSSDFRYERDPDDEPYLNLAIVSKAEYLVTRDRDLLDLTRGNNSDGQRLRLQAPLLHILDPVAFLQAIAVETMP